MAIEEKGRISRGLEGKAKEIEYKRNQNATSAWQRFFALLSDRLGKLCLTNLMILVPMLPLLAAVLFRGQFLINAATLYPFGSGIGIGYPGFPDLTGMAESVVLRTDLIFFAIFIACAFAAALGLAGGIEIIRTLVWTEGYYVPTEYFKGIRKNYLPALGACLLFAVMLYLVRYINALSDYLIVTGEGSAVWLIIAKVVSYIALVFVGMLSFWILAIGSSYRQGFFKLLKNAFVMMAGTLPQSLFFGFIASVPYLLFLLNVQLLTAIGIVAVVLISFSLSLLIWMCFAQWAFDRFVEESEPAKTSVAQTKAEEEPDEETKLLALLATGKSMLASRPMSGIDDALQVQELPQHFTRDDLKATAKTKALIYAQADAYAAEHRYDEEYAAYNKLWDDREKALESEKDKKGRKKKQSKPKLLNEQ